MRFLRLPSLNLAQAAGIVYSNRLIWPGAFLRLGHCGMASIGWPCFHSSLLPIASEGRPDVLQLCSNYFTFSFKLMKSAILWKGVIVVSIWSVKPGWVDHQLAIMASCIPWKPPFRTLLSKESKEFWTIWNFYQMGSFSGIILLPNLDFFIPVFIKVTLVVTPFVLIT